MKYLKKIFESTDDWDKVNKEITDSLVYINDKFGDPSIYSEKYGKSLIWNVKWDIKMNFSEFNDAEGMITKLRDIVEDIDDVLTTADRLENFTLDMALVGTELRLRFIPKDDGGVDTYRFINGQNGREISINISEITRYFNKNGVRVVKTDDDLNEIYQQSSVKITLDKRDAQVNTEFVSLFRSQKHEMETANRLNRPFDLYINGTIIEIYPEEEKTYIVI